MRASAPLRYLNDDAGLTEAQKLENFINSVEGRAAGADAITIIPSAATQHETSTGVAGTVGSIVPVRALDNLRPWCSATLVGANSFALQPGTYDFELIGSSNHQVTRTAAGDRAARMVTTVGLRDVATGTNYYVTHRRGTFNLENNGYLEPIAAIRESVVFAAATAVELRVDLTAVQEVVFSTGASSGANANYLHQLYVPLDPNTTDGTENGTYLRIIKRA